jgi:phytoene dehydrogenase-like protein
LKNIRYQGCVARLVFGLGDLPRFRSAAHRESDVKEGTLLSGHIVLCPNLEYLERAYDDAKYGDASHRPYLDLTIPTILDPSRAPKGKHLMLINAQFAPYQLKRGNWDEQRDAFMKRVIDMIETYAPGFSRLIEAGAILAPPDLEARFGLPEGCIHHGQMALDQLLFMRPIPGCSQYQTPIDGLYLCGAGTHPGGGLTGIPGYNAARIVARDLSARTYNR